MTTDFQAQVNNHYGRANLSDAILQGLRSAVKDPQRPSYDDLAPLDQFHSRGKLATIELAQSANLQLGIQVLDLGGGLGGPARTLAAEFGCRVTVLDLTQEYCRIGAMLTERTGLSELVTFRHGDALDLPFADASYDVVWTQHSSMNVENKERLYQEARRVLRPAGRLAIYEIMAGLLQPAHFPVPWAADPSISFLRPVAAMRSLIERTGFTELSFQDKSKIALAWFYERNASKPSTLPPLGLHLLVGDRFKLAFENVIRNLEEDRIAVIEAVYQVNDESSV